MMKIRNTITGEGVLCPHSRKEWVSAAIIGLASMGAAAWQAHQNRKAQREANAANAKLQKEQNDWSEEMYDKQNYYNSLSEQMARARGAGVNPYSVVNEGNVAGSGGQVPTGSSLGTQQPVSYNEGTSLVQTIAQLAGAYSDVSQGGKNDAETNRIKQTLTREIEGLELDNENKKAQNFKANLMNSLDAKWLPKKYRNEYYQDVRNILKTQADIDLIGAETYLKKCEGDLAKAKGETEVAMRTHLVEQARENVELIKAQTKTEQGKPAVQKSEIKRNNASAAESYEQAKDLRETRQARIDNLKADKDLHASMTKLNNIDYHVRNASVGKEIEAATAEFTAAAERSKLLNDELKEQIAYWKEQAEFAKKQKDWYAYTQAVQMMRDIAIAGGAAAGGYKAIKTAKPQRGKTKVVDGNRETTTYW